MCITGCSCGPAGEEPAETNDSSSSSSSGTGGSGGGEPSPCAEDCSAIETQQCMQAVCNTGQELGPINTCVIVASKKGTACEDGKYCTTGDSCDSGTCVSGTGTNDCGLTLGACEAAICYEDTKTCSVSPVNDGTTCAPADPCMVNGVCEVGECVGGEPKDCKLSPLAECNTVACEPATGQCTGTPDPFKDNSLCVLTGDLCKVDKTCQAGQCVGGNPLDCSGLDIGCEVGECDSATGICGPTEAPVGTACSEGVGQCQVGECNANGGCKASAAPNGTGCNDHDACTAGDQCATGACAGGAAVAGCKLYFKEGFETCPNGWTLAGDWQCGAPLNVGPPSGHTGNGVLATKIAGVYSVSQSFTTTVADSPAINLTLATNPTLSFWAWDHTEGGTFDGWNLKISTDGGTTFTTVTAVTPVYPLTIATQPAWGGNHSAQGWQHYMADLTAYAGQSVILRFAFRSDPATVYAGVYIDDLTVAEPLQTPLYITSSSLADVYAGQDMSVLLAKVGGTIGSVWSIVSGGVNTDWMTIDAATGELGGMPLATDVGPVSVTVRVAEPTLPSNYDDRTFTFDVVYDAYYTSFEGACPAGWTLTGDWQCGVPTAVGPATAYDGTQCIATQIAANYSHLQTYAGATATSPDIDLSASPFPTLTFRMWIDTEGGTHDGVNLKVSTDGGATFSVVNSVTPAYPLTVAGEPAWGGHQSGLGWQLMQADLSAYVGETIRLRFAFRSDSSSAFPGAYIDDIFVN
jgi:hypothetical protein